MCNFHKIMGLKATSFPMDDDLSQHMDDDLLIFKYPFKKNLFVFVLLYLKLILLY